MSILSPRTVIALLVLTELEACTPRRIELQSRWYLVEHTAPDNSAATAESEICPTLQLYLAVVNRQDAVIVEEASIGGMENPIFKGLEEPWERGGLREYDLGKFSCLLPTSLRVKVNGQWFETRPIPEQMPSSLPACPNSCPGSPVAQGPPSRSEPGRGRSRASQGLGASVR